MFLGGLFMLEVQKLLRTDGLATLENNYNIIVRRHKEHSNLVLLKYNMLESPMGERIVQECRGLILDENKNWEIVSYPFGKFFNINEGHAAPINWATASVQEKLDGSLMTLYYYKGMWRVASSGSPDASGSVNESMLEWKERGQLIQPFPIDFASYFWQIATLRGMSIHPLMDVPKKYCFMFEMMGPLNRIIVKHDISRIVLLSARDLTCGSEIPLSLAKNLLPGSIEVVQEFPLSSVEEIIKSFDHMNPVEQEGYVVIDKEFHRIKIKCPAYVALHHVKGNGEVTPKQLLKIAMAGENDEWVSYFEEFKDDLLRIRAMLEDFIDLVSKDYTDISQQIGPGGSQKDFAVLATQTRCSGALFALRSGRTDSVRSYTRGIQVEKLLELIWKPSTATQGRK